MTTHRNTIELTAIFQREIRCINDGTPQRWMVGNVTQKSETGTKYITIIGECQKNALRPNVEYRFAGIWKNHPTYGEQFAFDSFTQPEPITQEAIVGYLTQCPKIGAMRAEKIYNTLGHDCIAKIKTDPNVLRHISGLTKEHRKNIQKFLCGKEAKEQATLELQTLLKGIGLPKRIFQWLDLDYGTAAAACVRENPFLLTKYRGVGFELADKVYERLGLPPAGILRQWNYLVYLLTSDGSGSTWLPEKTLWNQFNTKFAIHGMQIGDFIAAQMKAIQKNKIVMIWSDDKPYFSLPHLAACESAVVRWIYDRCQQPGQWVKELVVNGQDQPSEHQLQAYADAIQAAVGLLIGSPGTGKTWLTGRIIDSLQRRGDSYAVCAPTGKAALRVMESLKLQGVSVMATTIHKLLDARYGKDGWEFTYNADYKLPYDFIIVDESSMIDIVLLKSLLDAVKNGANVLFVGDHEQLPPVGKGAPLRDMIQSGVPCGRLTEIRRNAGEIVKACAAIRDNAPLPVMAVHPESGDNLIFCRMTPEQDRVVQFIKNIVAFEEKNNESFDPLQDCQIIVPLNDASKISRNALNPLLQDYFNPMETPGEILVQGQNVSKVQKFRRGDKIVNLTNGYADGENGKVYVANGEIGIVHDFSATSLHVKVNGQIIQVPTYSEWGEHNFDLAYTITAHRSQGSEWQVVIVVLDPAYGAQQIADKHWVYTSISRAKRRCYIIGMSGTLASMCAKSGMWNRQTLFVEEFQNCKGE